MQEISGGEMFTLLGQKRIELLYTGNDSGKVGGL
jgi:hypothetical protein